MKGKHKTFILEHLLLAGLWTAYAITFVFGVLSACFFFTIIVKLLLAVTGR